MVGFGIDVVERLGSATTLLVGQSVSQLLVICNEYIVVYVSEQYEATHDLCCSVCCQGDFVYVGTLKCQLTYFST
jgi:hypothetical protein